MHSRFFSRSARLLAALTCATLFARAADNWPQFRGPTGDGHSDAKKLPVSFGETERVKWKTEIHGKAWSSPVIWKNQIWLTTANLEGTELSVVCVDKETGKILPPEFHAVVPKDRMEQVRAVADTLGKDVYAKFPLLPGMKTMHSDLIELVLNRTWRPSLSITGAAGLPGLESAGNVLRPKTSLKISLRLPPTKDAAKANEDLKRILEQDPPYGAKVTFRADGSGAGWNAPPMSPWLSKAVERASKAFFGKPAVYMGEGGSIPFMGMLGARFPNAQFLITGVLGPNSNAHGPNEFLDLPTGKKLTASVASVLAEHATRS